MKKVTQLWPEKLADQYRSKGYWTGETFPDLLHKWIESHPQSLALVDDRHRWTYSDLACHAWHFAKHMREFGLKPGDRVIVNIPNIAEFVSTIFGLFCEQLLPVYTLPAHGTAELTHLAKTSHAAAIVTAHNPNEPAAIARIQAIVDQCPNLEHVVNVLDDQRDQPSSDPVNTVLSEISTIEKPDANAVAFMQISGGSTGFPKLIPRTHNDYLYSVRESAKICGLNDRSIYLAALPLAHNFPMSSPGFLGVLLTGGCVVMSRSAAPETAFRLIEDEKVTIAAVVPPLAIAWLNSARTTTRDLSSLEVLQVGGAKFLPELAKQVSPVLGCKLQQVFGMAEGLVNYTRLDDPEEMVINTQGRPISPDDEIRIVDEYGKAVGFEKAGILTVRGPYTINSYYDNPEANKKSFTEDGFYITGDVVSRNIQGYLTVHGRLEDHINRAGEKISAEELENHILAHPGVVDAAVVSIPDEVLGERSCAFVISDNSKADTKLSKGEIRDFVRSTGIAEFKIPDQIVFVDRLRTTALGKISRRKLRAALREEFLQEIKKAG